MQALALKYRPKNFESLIGQNVVASSLSHALDSGRIGHAYLFSGLRGSGKTSSARIFAKALLCEEGISSHPCEKCANCIMANENRHLDIVEMDAASHRKIDDIRELIEHTKYSPASARFKIFIIDEVHMLTKEAFNALLKTLEEPPSYVKFILATTDPLKLPATILSRTQHFRFKSIAKNDIIKHLEFILNKEGIKYEPKAIEILARSGSGSLRDTLTLLDQAIIFSHEFVSQQAVASMLGLLDPSQIEQIIQIIANRDKTALLDILKDLDSSDSEVIIDELITNLKDKFIHQNSTFSMLIFERFFRILSEAKNMLLMGSDPEFTLYITLFMMIEAFNLTNINDAIKKINNQNTPQIIQQTPPTSKQSQEVKTDYEKFIEKIYDRDFELGKCFDECIKFVSFDGNYVILNSTATGKSQTMLRDSSKTILEILKATFGSNAKIKINKEENEAPKQNQEVNGVEKLMANINLQPQTKEADSPLAGENSTADAIKKVIKPRQINQTEENINTLVKYFGDFQVEDS